QVLEVGRDGDLGKLEALALHDVGSETGGRLGWGVGREEPYVPDEQAPDDGIFTGADRGLPVVPDAKAHLFEAGRSAGLAEQLPCLGQPHRREVAVEPAAGDAVVRIVGLEKEWLPDGQGMEPTAATRTPEIDFCEAGPSRQEVVPVVVGHPDVTPHGSIMPLTWPCRWSLVREALIPGRINDRKWPTMRRTTSGSRTSRPSSRMSPRARPAS